MAQVPYDQGIQSVLPQTQAPQDYQHEVATPEEAGGLIAQGEQKLGAGASQAGKFFGEVAADHATNQYLDQSNKLLFGTGQIDPATGVPDRGFYGLSGEDAVRAQPQVMAQLTKLRDDLRGNMLTPEQEQMFDQNTRFMQFRMQGEIGRHYDEQFKAYAGKTNQDGYAQTLNSIALRPQDDAFAQDAIHTALAYRVKQLQLEGQTSPEAMQTAQLETARDVSEARVMALAPTDPVAAQGIFNKSRPLLQGSKNYDAISSRMDRAAADHYSDLAAVNVGQARRDFEANRANLSPGAVSEIDARLTQKEYVQELRDERQQNKVAAQVRVGLNRSFSEADTIVSNGQSASKALEGITDRQITAAFPNDPDMAQTFQERVADLRVTSAYLDQLAGATPDQVQKIIAQTPKPDPNDPGTYRERMMVNRALSSALDRTAKALAADPAAYVLGSHPEVMALGAAADKDPKQFPAYAQSILGVQAQMGVPEGDRSVLPVPAAQQLAGSIMADPENAPAKLRGMQQKYGPYWSNVWRDLTGVKGGLPAAYQAVGVLDDQGQAALLARGLAEQGKSGKALADLLPPKAKTGPSGIDNQVESDPDWEKLRMSLSRSGATAEMQSDVLGAIKTLAYANAVYSGKDPAAAVATAVDAFAGKFDYMPNGGARVPKDKMDAVSANAAALLRVLAAANTPGPASQRIALPPIFGKPGMPNAEDYLNTLRAAPTWITSPSADSLWLMDPEGRIVRGKDGDPVKVPFDAPAGTMPAAAAPPGVVPGL